MALLLATTPPGLNKNHLVCHRILLRLSTKGQADVTNYSAYAKTSEKNYTHRKLNTHKLNNPNAEKITINRNKYSYMLSIYAKITLYSVRHEQLINTEHRKLKRSKSI